MRRLIFSLVPLIVLASAVELALRGVWTPPPSAEIGAGFDLSGIHVVLDDQAKYGWRFGREAVPRPRDPGRKLVVLLGGSNTQNFPHPFLEQAIAKRLRRTDLAVDVVNMGRAGFGSDRVVGMFEKALELEPDLVVVYIGHNEIIERELQRDVEREWRGWSGSLARLFAPLRTFQALVAALSEEPAEGNAGNAPADRIAAEERKFESYRLADTLERFEKYRANLEHIADVARERRIPLVLSTVVFNLVSPPFVSNRPPEVDDASWRRATELLDEVRAAWPAALRAMDPSVGLMERPYSWDWNAHGGRREKAPPRVEPRELGGPMESLGPLWPAQSAWSDEIRAFVAQMDAFWARRLDAADLAALERCAPSLDQILALAPDLPEAHFRRAVVAWIAGDGALAAEGFELAAELDRAPRKASRRTNDITRAVAAAGGVALFDADREFRARFPLGLVGWEVMSDHCHLHERGYALLMNDLADFLTPLLDAPGETR